MASPILLVDDNQELLKLLVQLFEDAGHQVISAARGRQAIDVCRSQPPALAVLDVLLPDMTGYSLADALRKQNPNLPLIFITGVFKAGRHALDARQKYSVLAYFEKPFDSKKLLEAVAKVIPPERRQNPEPDEDPFHVEMDVDYLEEGPPSDPLELTGRIKLTDLEKGATEIAGKNLTARPMNRDDTGPIRPPAAEATPTAMAPLVFGPKVRRGELRNNLPSLITAFYISNETGELGVQRGRVKKVIYFEKGQPVFALSNLISDRFGQFLVRVGKIKAHQLQEALQLGAGTKRRTGDILVEKGLLEPTERMYYVGQQVKAIIYTLFGWEEGTYVLQLKDQASAEPIKLDVHPATLISRGIKKLYKPERLRQLLLPHDKLMPSGQPAYPLHEIKLEDWEAHLLSRIDGTRPVSELLIEAKRAERTVLSFLYSMVALTVLERAM